jgi:hypothetical protein
MIDFIVSIQAKRKVQGLNPTAQSKYGERKIREID